MDNIKILKSQVAMQSIKYIITGGASYLVDFVLCGFLYLRVSGCVYIGLFTGLGVNYILSKYWVFENKMPVSKRDFLLLFFYGIWFCAYRYRNVYMRRYIASER